MMVLMMVLACATSAFAYEKVYESKEKIVYICDSNEDHNALQQNLSNQLKDVEEKKTSFYSRSTKSNIAEDLGVSTDKIVAVIEYKENGLSYSYFVYSNESWHSMNFIFSWYMKNNYDKSKRPNLSKVFENNEEDAKKIKAEMEAKLKERVQERKPTVNTGNVTTAPASIKVPSVKVK